jgi:hypothetical protein
MFLETLLEKYFAEIFVEKLRKHFVEMILQKI